MIIYANHGYPSMMTRGEQIATRAGFGFNTPYEEIPEGEVVVFVKGFNSYSPTSLIKNKNCSVYLDIVDSDVFLPELANHPYIGIIAISDAANSYIRARLPFTKNIITIDEQHCNFDNERRTRKEVTRVGYVGSKYRFNLSIDFVKAELAKEGFEFVCLFCEDLSLSRKDICEFYKKIDIQLCMFVPSFTNNMPPELKNPLKLANAGSFGIPTVGIPEFCWKTEYGSYIDAFTMEGVIDACRSLRDLPIIYGATANRAMHLSEKYHIDDIVKKYKELK